MTAIIEFHFDVRLLCWQMYLVMCDPVLVTTKYVRNVVENYVINNNE